MSYTVKNLIPNRLSELKEKNKHPEYLRAINEAYNVVIDVFKNSCLIEWCVEDVLSRAEFLNKTITEKQAQDIIEKMEENHDCELGVTWGTIDDYIYELDTKSIM